MRLLCLNHIYFCYHDNRGRPIWTKQILSCIYFLNRSRFCSIILAAYLLQFPWTQRSSPAVSSRLHPCRLNLKVAATTYVVFWLEAEISRVVEKWVYDTQDEYLRPLLASCDHETSNQLNVDHFCLYWTATRNTQAHSTGTQHKKKQLREFLTQRGEQKWNSHVAQLT